MKELLDSKEKSDFIKEEEEEETKAESGIQNDIKEQLENKNERNRRINIIALENLNQSKVLRKSRSWCSTNTNMIVVRDSSASPVRKRRVSAFLERGRRISTVSDKDIVIGMTTDPEGSLRGSNVFLDKALSRKESEVGGKLGAITEEEDSIKKTLCRFLPDVAVLRLPIFPVLTLGFALTTLVNVSYFIHLPALMRQINVEQAETTLLLSCIAITEFGGRLVVPFILDYFSSQRKYVYLLFTVFTATTCIVTTFFNQLTACIIVGCVTTFTAGACRALLNTLVADYVGPIRFPSVLGWIQLIMGVMLLILGPSIGAVKDYTGDVRMCYYVIGGLGFTNAIACCFEPLAMKSMRRMEKANGIV